MYLNDFSSVLCNYTRNDCIKVTDYNLYLIKFFYLQQELFCDILYPAKILYKSHLSSIHVRKANT
jgi:hypothetical protein